MIIFLASCSILDYEEVKMIANLVKITLARINARSTKFPLERQVISSKSIF